MSSTPQTSFFSKSTDSRVQLLRNAAMQLFEDHVIAHPSNAAIAKYDETENVARYVHLFHDWLPDWAHLKYHDFYLDEELRKFQTKASQLATQHNKVAEEFAQAFLGKTPLEQLTVIGEQLKTIYFYSPATGGILHSIKQSGRCWNFTKLDYTYLRNTMSNRDMAETRTGKSGHWEYGVELEQIYLSTGAFNVFGEFFLQDKQSNEVLAITAACINVANAQRIANLDKVFQNFKGKYIPLPIILPDLDSSPRPKRQPKIPSADDIISKMSPGDDHEDKQRRNEIANKIKSLSDQQRLKLDSVAVPKYGAKTVSLNSMEEALNNLNNP
jgi:hypothetical protein